MAPVARPIDERFWEKVAQLPNGCWEWTATTSHGYGYFGIGRRPDGRILQVRAHRFAYEALRGPIPADKVIDHLCRNRACVNPNHLECVTSKVNAERRGDAKTHCKAGHPRDQANTYRAPKTGRSHCRICAREASRLYTLKGRAA